MELRHFRYFVSVAEAGHFTKAASRLGVAVPTLSRQIKDMEEELGVLLLERTQRKVKLTAAGEALLANARQVIQGFDAAQRQAQRAGRGETGRLEIGYVASAVYGGVLQRHVSGFRRDWDSVELHVSEWPMHNLPEHVAEGRIDLAYVRAPVLLPESLSMIDLDSEPFILALHAENPLASASAIDPRRLASEMFIMPEQSAGTFRVGELGGFSPQIVRQPGSLVAVLALVSLGQGVAVVPNSVVSKVCLPDIVFRSITGLQICSWLGLVFRRFDRERVIHRYLETVRELSNRSQSS